MLFNVVRQPRNLRVTIPGRNHCEDRLVKSAADNFHLPFSHQPAELFEIFRMRALHPFQQRSGVVQSHVNGRVFFEKLDKRQVTSVVGFLEHVAEIAAGLVRVNQQDEMEILRHGDNFARYTSYRAPRFSFQGVAAVRLSRKLHSLDARRRGQGAIDTRIVLVKGYL